MGKFKTLALLAGSAAAGAYAVRRSLENYVPQQAEADSDTVLLYQFDYSPFCAKVRHILDYKRVPYQTVELTPILHRAFSRRLSGQIKVPYLRHKDQVIADSSAIARYLEETFPNPSLLPADPQAREQVLLLEDWLDEALQPALSKVAYLYLYLHPEIVIEDPAIGTGVDFLDQHKDKLVPLMLGMSVRKNQLTEADMPRLEERLNEVLSRLQGLLKGKDYLVGDRISLADLTLTGHLSTAVRLPELTANPRWQWLFEWNEKVLKEIQAAEAVKAT
ncbi:MAG TPA: glutathione S-transferase family protein [Candidatus Obscuribacterales bacterium]